MKGIKFGLGPSFTKRNYLKYRVVCTTSMCTQLWSCFEFFNISVLRLVAWSVTNTHISVLVNFRVQNESGQSCSRYFNISNWDRVWTQYLLPIYASTNIGWHHISVLTQNISIVLTTGSELTLIKLMRRFQVHTVMKGITWSYRKKFDTRNRIIYIENVNNIPTMRFFTGISENILLKSYVIIDWVCQGIPK